MNIHEDKARLEKALKILERVPYGATRDDIDITAGWLRGLDADARAALAFVAGVKPPSAATWEMVCKMAAQRKTADEVLAMHEDVRPRAGTDASPVDVAGFDKARMAKRARGGR
ncbi:MAG: hypothetical protein V4537_14195 [Pseudomonadota bacterium]